LRPPAAQVTLRAVRRLLLLAALVGLVTAPGAFAGPPGTWTRITDTNLRNIDEVAVARTQDGNLHVVWPTEVGALDYAVKHVSVSSAGSPGMATTAVAGKHGISNPDLIVSPDGSLRLFYGATTGLNETDGIRTATAGADGGTWTDQAAPSSAANQPDSVGATLLADGTPIFAWGISFSLFVHFGFEEVGSEVDLRTETACCDYDPDLATNGASGQTIIAWFSNADGEHGTWVQTVAPSQGQKQLVPGSADDGNAIQPQQRTAISARLGAPGVYVGYCGGYPTCKRALLWRVGSGRPMTVGTGNDVEDVDVTRGPDGRLWVFWHDGTAIRAARTNEAASRIGAIVSVKPPNGTETTWKLEGEGSLGRLDLLAHVTTPNSLAAWHTQVLPGLTLVCKGGKVVSCTVTDAGVPIAGAKVRIGGKTLTTNARGKASVDLPARRFSATAAKAGYTGAKAAVRST
jgi:hypothetical protein